MNNTRPHGADFPIENLPYGAFVASGQTQPRLGVAIGEDILDLNECAARGLFSEELADCTPLQRPNLNALLELGSAAWQAVRRRSREIIEQNCGPLIAQRDVRMTLPFLPGDYVDFYSSLEHATNMGRMLRPDGEALLPNWRHLPIGYHGRSSTIVVDGTPVFRPCGQRKPPGADAPDFGPTRSLDIELEMGFVTGAPTTYGVPMPIGAARDHIFGLVIVNDWSARDIQAWEYQPLGPFLGKSFATSVSPWVVTLDALEPYRVAGPVQEPAPFPYLRSTEPFAYDIELEVWLRTRRMEEAAQPAVRIAHSNYRELYWNMAQQLAHVSSNGTAIRAGDLYASGTISGSSQESFGSLMELTWRGTKPLHLGSGEERGFLEDGDTITLRAVAQREGLPRIGFGSVSGTVVGAPVQVAAGSSIQERK